MDIIQATMKLMAIRLIKKPDTAVYRAIQCMAFVFSVICLWVAVSFVFYSAGASSSVSVSAGIWRLHVAALMLPVSADINSALSARYVEQAALADNLDSAYDSLEQAVVYIQKAADQRPLWPYYKVSMLELDILLRRPSDDIRSIFQSIMVLAPNERGLDPFLFRQVVAGWAELTDEQRKWALLRMHSASGESLKVVIESADLVGMKMYFCAKLPWSSVSRYCKG
jgi:hypothetical protein